MPERREAQRPKPVGNHPMTINTEGAPYANSSSEGETMPDVTQANTSAVEAAASQEIAKIVSWWLRYTRESREREGLETTPDTHVIMPTWPTVGQLEHWVAALTAANIG